MTRFSVLPAGVFLSAIFLSASAYAQTPQTRMTYQDQGGTVGHSLVIDGKTFGPYKEISSVTRSTSGTAGLFLTSRRDKTYVVAQGREWGPLTAGYDADQKYISDDGKVWAVTAVQNTDAESEDEESKTQTVLWVNGKSYGPYESLYDFEYAETGGGWIANLRVSDDEYEVILNGKDLGSFPSVEHIWMFPDGKDWGYAVTEDDATTVFTSAKTYDEVQSFDFNAMYPRDPHWGYAIQADDEEELIVVDGKTYPGYRHFNGLNLTATSRHWGFEAEKLADAGDYPVVVVDGKEFLGEGLTTGILGDKEFFLWTVNDGTKVTTQVLTLP